jgi:hypothetical protein
MAKQPSKSARVDSSAAGSAVLAATNEFVQFVRELRVGRECRGRCISLCGTTAREVDRRVEPAAVLNTACSFAAGVVRDAANCESDDHGVHHAARMRAMALSKWWIAMSRST